MAIAQRDKAEIKEIVLSELGKGALTQVNARITQAGEQILLLQKNIAETSNIINQQTDVFVNTLKKSLSVLDDDFNIDLSEAVVVSLISAVKEYSCRIAEAEGHIKYNEITQAGRTERGSRY